jgi:pimeloyl-ACP methyl ester carboxylesterase
MTNQQDFVADTPGIHDLSPPKRSLIALEARVVSDFASMLSPWLKSTLKRSPASKERLVIVVPGFGASDTYTRPLRRFLSSLGYRAEGWGLGKNLAGTDLPHDLSDLSDHWQLDHRDDYNGEAGVPLLVDRLVPRVKARHEETGEPVSLIGWSLGGFIAREVARELPGVVDRVITLGSPTVGGPKYTAAAPFFRKRGQDLDWIESQIKRREVRPIQQPVYAVVSKTDAIVDWRAALDWHSPAVEHIEVDASHLGMGFNQEIWGLLEELLARE